MFTGIVEGTGELTGIRRKGQEATCTLLVPESFSDCRPGDSIAVDGVCLTITSVRGTVLALDISAETLARSTLGCLRQGSKVNVERALKLSDRLGGHLVSGHIDGTGVIETIERIQESWIIRIGVDKELSRYLIEKGSIAVDGVSLTINRCMRGSFEVTIIPQTARETTISRKRRGDRVNVEVDMISKYVEKFVSSEKGEEAAQRESSRIDREMLLKYGFGGGNGTL